MSTQLHNSPIYGPVHSRRLGLSVGINLMPADGKYCTFDCIYCECGYNHERQTRTPRPTVAEVTAALERQLQTMADDGSRPDVLTLPATANPPPIPISPKSSTPPSPCATAIAPTRAYRC